MSAKKRKRKRAKRHTMSMRKRLWIRQRYRCTICGKQIRQRNLFSKSINIDHIRPRSHGGPSEPWNLAVVHLDCNQAKGSKCAGCDQCPDKAQLDQMGANASVSSSDKSGLQSETSRSGDS